MAIYNFKDHIKGDTWKNPPSFQIIKNGTPINLTGATIVFRLIDGSLTLTSTDGITITDPTLGKFAFNKRIINIPARVYFYDIQITLSNGDITTYLAGTWEIKQDIV
jgi:hypothetical protein